MIAIVSLLVILVVSFLITRFATIALTATGLSQQAARFQARSAFTGVGYTTSESEKVVNHPVRRRIVMTLMVLGNAGVVTAISSLLLGLLQADGAVGLSLYMVLLVVAVVALWLVVNIPPVDRSLSRFMAWTLRRWTHLDVRDYAQLLHIGGDYRVVELGVEGGDWLAGRALETLRLREEGIVVLGIERAGGSYVGAPLGETELHVGDTLLLYGRGEALQALDRRRASIGGELAHADAVAKQARIEASERDDSGGTAN